MIELPNVGTYCIHPYVFTYFNENEYDNLNDSLQPHYGVFKANKITF